MLFETTKIGFYDARLEQTYGELGTALHHRFTGQLNCLAQNRAQQKRFSDFLHNPRVHLDQLMWKMIRTAREQVQRAGLDHLLVASDTSEANLKATQGYRQDQHLGVTGNNADPGFFIHPGLALCPSSGQPLGCVSLQVWTRDGGRDIEYSESQKWFQTARHVKHLARRVTVINDREGDIYHLWVHLRQQNMFMVTRARQDRTLAAVPGRSGRLWKRLAETEVSGSFQHHLPEDKTEGRSARKTEFSLRLTPVALKTPEYVSRKAKGGQVDLMAIEVHERMECVPDGEKPVVWRLLTNHNVITFEQALEIVQWYVYRWRIEDTFSALKTRGMNLEATRLEDGMAVMKLGVMSYESATKITQLVKAREDKITPATAFFTNSELECMDALLPELQGRTEKHKNPYPSRTAAWAVWIIARLGHWHGNGKPGLIMIRRGLKRFDGILIGYNIKRIT